MTLFSPMPESPLPFINLTTTPQSHMSATILSRFTPIQRILLSSSGTLQQTLSALHDSTITLTILLNQFISSPYSQNGSSQASDVVGVDGYYNRRVCLSTTRRLVIAVSRVTCTSFEAREAISSGRIGIGQLLTYFGLLPTFKLLSCSHHTDPDFPTAFIKEQATADGVKKEDVEMWREYELGSKHFRCEITEYFLIGSTDITDPFPSNTQF